jgi:hypothetical protein
MFRKNAGGSHCWVRFLNVGFVLNSLLVLSFSGIVQFTHDLTSLIDFGKKVKIPSVEFRREEDETF